MDVGVYAYTAGDPVLIDKIVNEFLSQGKFDKLRKECMADADTKPAYQNLQQRVESTVTQFLKKQVWKPDINKNQLRDSLRKHISESGFLDAGINRIVDQIVNPNVLATVFMPEVEEVVYSYLSIPRPGDKSNKHCDNAKTYSNYKVKHQSTDELKGKLDIDRDFKKSQKNEENQTNNFYERLKSEDFEDKTNGQKCENISSAESVADLQTETTRDTQSEIKAESEETEEMKECKSEMVQEEGNESNGKFFPEKMEVPSDDSQESLSRMGVERLRISDSDGVNAADSDASLPLEINEKSMSDSRDSDDSIMNKMSPISQGRLSPEEGCAEEEKETKEGKKPLTFVGRIPKIKRDDSEAKKAEEVPKRSEGKSVYSSDESDSSKHSSGKSDAEEKKKKTATAEEERPEVPKEKSDRKYKEEDRKRKSDHHRSSDGRSRSRDEKRDKSRSRREEKDKGHSRSRDERSRDKNSSGDKKSSSSSSHSRSRSSSHHKSGGRKSGSHEKEHHRDDSRSREKDRSRHDRKERDKRDFDRRKREEEKRKKSKSVDDHGKERNRRDDRRSTDRDSNERERDKTKEAGSGVVQSDGKRGREKDQKDETKRERNQKEESDSRNERDGESAQTVKTEGEREGGARPRTWRLPRATAPRERREGSLPAPPSPRCWT